MEITEIAKELNNLKEMVQLIDANVKFNINFFLATMAVVAAFVGGALYIWAKFIVSKALERKAREIEQNIWVSLKPDIDYLKKHSIREYGNNANGEYIIWNNGLQICRANLKLTYKTPKELSGVWVFPASFSGPVNVNISLLGNTVSEPWNCTVYQTGLSTTSVNIHIKKALGNPFSNEDTAEVTVLAIGK